MWRDPAWLLDMLAAAQKVQEYVAGIDEAQFLASSRDQDAVLRQLTVLGEAAKRVSQEFRADHPEIPWRQIAGLRDVVVHDYLLVDLEEVWRITQEDIPPLISLMVPFIPPFEE